jgi:hypothetical protein
MLDPRGSLNVTLLEALPSAPTAQTAMRPIP